MGCNRSSAVVLTEAEKRDTNFSRSDFVVRSTGSVIDNYTLIKTLGQGQFGLVNLVQNKKNGRTYALKQIRIRESQDYDLETIKQEIEILRNLSHPHLVSIYEYYFEKKFVYIVTE